MSEQTSNTEDFQESDSTEAPEDDTRSIEELFHAALTDPDEDALWVAVSALQSRTSLEALQQRRQGCTSENKRLRDYIARELSKLELPEALLHTALAHPDDDAIWETVATHVRALAQAVFERARQLCMSESARERLVGAGILGQMGRPDETIQEESVKVLLGMLEREQDPGVLYSVAVALGHRKDPRAIPLLIQLKNHPNKNVRYGVVHGLMGYEDERAIQALIELSADEDSAVRDWATFGLGSMIDIDTPAIREALVARLTDEDPDTRAEAMMGLAHRHDERAVEPLVAHFKDRWYSGALFEAAGELGDPRLYPVLVEWQDKWDEEKTGVYEKLEEALEKCQPAPDA